MKVYLLYAYPSIIRPGTEDINDGVKELYALTNVKSLYKDFKKNLLLFPKVCLWG